MATLNELEQRVVEGLRSTLDMLEKSFRQSRRMNRGRYSEWLADERRKARNLGSGALYLTYRLMEYENLPSVDAVYDEFEKRVEALMPPRKAVA